MKRIIHHLRKQPEETRRHILHLIILILAALMIGLWVLSLGKNFSNPDTKIKMKQDLKPFSALKNNLVDGYNNASSTQ